MIKKKILKLLLRRAMLKNIYIFVIIFTNAYIIQYIEYWYEPYRLLRIVYACKNASYLVFFLKLLKKRTITFMIYLVRIIKIFYTNYNTTPHPHHLFIIYTKAPAYLRMHTTLIYFVHDMSYHITVGVPSLYDTLHFFIVIIFIRVIFILPMFLTSIRSF